MVLPGPKQCSSNALFQPIDYEIHEQTTTCEETVITGAK